ncbi:MAG: EI24 domain-containing protein [Pseudomonadota bacterium]
MLRYFTRALGQLDDPIFRRVLLLGLIGAFIAFIGAYLAARWGLGRVSAYDFAWADRAVDWALELGGLAAFLIAAYLLFPAVATAMMGLFLDDIVDAVEARHYPARRASRRLGVLAGVTAGLRLGLAIVFWNLLALPLYLILWFTGVGAIILYGLLNGYLLGREYLEMVALRHMKGRDAKRQRKANRGTVLGVGLAGTALFMIPVVNLLAPLLTTAAAVHAFHAIADDEA